MVDISSRDLLSDSPVYDFIQAKKKNTPEKELQIPIPSLLHHPAAQYPRNDLPNPLLPNSTMFGLNSLRPALKTANTTTVFRSFSASARRDFARLTVVGRMGVQPEVTTTSTGREIVKYVVAASHGPRDNPQTSWFRITSFQPDGPGRKYLLNVPKGYVFRPRARIGPSCGLFLHSRASDDSLL